MTNPLKHLFWDFDGTLYDSYPQVARAMRLALEDFDVHETDAALMPQLKITVVHTVEKYSQQNGLKYDELMRAFHLHHKAEPPFPPYAGLKACLRTLKAAGVSHYLYTHRDLRAVEQLKLDGLWDCFDDAVTDEDGFASKPAPDALLALMARHGLNANECAMIGDRDIDVGSGKNAGMRTILFDPDDFYPNFDADIKVKSMRELCDRVLG